MKMQNSKPFSFSQREREVSLFKRFTRNIPSAWKQTPLFGDNKTCAWKKVGYVWVTCVIICIVNSKNMQANNYSRNSFRGAMNTNEARQLKLKTMQKNVAQQKNESFSLISNSFTVLIFLIIQYSFILCYLKPLTFL